MVVGNSPRGGNDVGKVIDLQSPGEYEKGIMGKECWNEGILRDSTLCI
jgi:hypothetical protein